MQSLAEAKGLGRSNHCSFVRTVHSGTVESFCICTQKHWENEMALFLECNRILQGMLTVQSVQTLLGNSKKTNGPEGTVASKTIRSVNMIKQGLTRLQSNIAKINPELTLNPEALLLYTTLGILRLQPWNQQKE